MEEEQMIGAPTPNADEEAKQIELGQYLTNQNERINRLEDGQVTILRAISRIFEILTVLEQSVNRLGNGVGQVRRAESAFDTFAASLIHQPELHQEAKSAFSRPEDDDVIYVNNEITATSHQMVKLLNQMLPKVARLIDHVGAMDLLVLDAETGLNMWNELAVKARGIVDDLMVAKAYGFEFQRQADLAEEAVAESEPNF